MSPDPVFIGHGIFITRNLHRKGIPDFRIRLPEKATLMTLEDFSNMVQDLAEYLKENDVRTRQERNMKEKKDAHLREHRLQHIDAQIEQHSLQIKRLEEQREKIVDFRPEKAVTDSNATMTATTTNTGTMRARIWAERPDIFIEDITEVDIVKALKPTNDWLEKLKAHYAPYDELLKAEPLIPLDIKSVLAKEGMPILIDEERFNELKEKSELVVIYEKQYGNITKYAVELEHKLEAVKKWLQELEEITPLYYPDAGIKNLKKILEDLE